MGNITHYRLTLFWSRYVRSFSVSGSPGAPRRALQAARRAVSPLGLRPLTWAPPSTSRRTRRSLPEEAALMRGLQSDRWSPIAWRVKKSQTAFSLMNVHYVTIVHFQQQNTLLSEYWASLFHISLENLVQWWVLLIINCFRWNSFRQNMKVQYTQR